MWVWKPICSFTENSRNSTKQHEGLTMKLLRLAFWILLGISVSSVSSGNCDRWITGQDAGGYCTDYIAIATGGYRQSGDAGNWTGNVTSANIQPGDVAIFNSGSFGHVAYIEEVHRNSNGVPSTIDISEYNWGGYSGQTEEEVACTVTINYGVRTTRDGIPVSSVTRFWHPPHPGETDPSTVSGNTFNVYKVGNYAWYPSDVSCINASHWYGIDSSGKVMCSYSSSFICYDIYRGAGLGADYNLFFGSGQLTCHK